jgi:predicted TIM-barrel fold metal-dependent hydrolase
VIIPFPSSSAQFDANSYWYEIENKLIVDTAVSNDRFIPFLGVNPSDKRCRKNIEVLAGMFPVKGVKLMHQNIIKFPIDRLIGNPIMKTVKDNKMIFMIHIGTGKEKEGYQYHSTLDYALRVARKYRDITFVLSHLGRLHEDFFDALSCENIYMDTSGISFKPWSMFTASECREELSKYSPTRILEMLADLGHESKIVWGSDEPYTTYEEELGIILDAEISESKKRMMMSGNASRLLGLQ